MASWKLCLLQTAAGTTVGRAVAAAAVAAGTLAAVEIAVAVDTAAAGVETASAADSLGQHGEGYPGEPVGHIDL